MKLFNYFFILISITILISAINTDQSFLKKQNVKDLKDNTKDNRKEVTSNTVSIHDESQDNIDNLIPHFDKLLPSRKYRKAEQDLSQTGSSRIYEGICFVKIKGWLYDLSPMGFKDDNTYLIENKKSKIDLNFCRDIPNYCYDGKRGLIVDKHKCVRYAGEWTQDKEWTIEKYSNGTSRLLIDFPDGDPCPAGGNYTVTLDLTCDPSVRKGKLLNREEFDPDKCSNVLKAVTPFACPTVKFVAWYQRFFLHKYIVASLMVILGFGLCFLGSHFSKVSSTMILGVGLAVFFHHIVEVFHVDVPFLFSVGVGIGLALLIFFAENSRYPLMAVIQGFFLGNFLHPALFKMLDVDPDNIYYIIVFTCILICLVIYLFINQYFIVISTAYFGAYAAIRGLSLVLGRFPDEGLLETLIKKSEYNQVYRVFGGTFIYYFAGILTMLAAGIAVQMIFKPDNLLGSGEKKEQDENQPLNKKSNHED